MRFDLVRLDAIVYENIKNFLNSPEGIIYPDFTDYVEIPIYNDKFVYDFSWRMDIIENSEEIQNILHKMGYLTYRYYD